MSLQNQGDVQSLPLGSQIVTAIQGRPVSNSAPAPGQIMGWAATNKQWTPVYPPGYEIGYDQITAGVNVTGLAASTATTIIAGSAHSFDGGFVIAEFFAPLVGTPSAAVGSSVVICLFENTACIADLAKLFTPAAAVMDVPVRAALRFTPSVGSHTYSIKAYASSTTGTPQIAAGAAGSDVLVPAYLRFTKV